MSNNQKRNGPKFGPGGMHGMRGSGEKAKDFKGTLGKLFKYLKPYYVKLVIVLIFASASTVFAIVGPKILAKATDKLGEGIMAKVNGSGGIDFEYIAYIIWILVGLYLLSAVFSYIQGFITSTISQKVAYDLRTSISTKMDRMPLSYFDRHTSGDILSRVTNDIDTIAQSLNQSMSQVITSSVMVVGIFIMMLTISPQMTLIAICVLPVSIILIGLVMKRSQKYFARQQQALGDVNGHIEEMYGGHNVVKAFNGEEASVKQFNEFNDSLYESAWKSQFFSGLMQPITIFIGNVGYVAVCLLGGVLAGGGNITIGDIQAFIQYVRQFNQPITQLAQTMNMLQSTAAAAERVFEFLGEEELELETPKVGSQDVAKINGSVTFADVKFGYLKNQTIINDFNLHVHAGQTVAIVGPTGAGKTTIIKLLMRFYELNSGSIYIDGIDIRDFGRKDLRSLFGIVLQDTWLFNGTIKENLMYGKLNASDQEVKEACKVAYADHFIQTLEDGYDTIINEESSNISQGQKQLLTIARAFLKDPKILILDEATSSVDTRTEVLIQRGMEKLMEGRTSFVIAHRLSTIRDADTIIVMKDGDIVELGNHDSLLAKDGFYASLYRSQFEGISE
ncbi:ABC transporter ATP-binding protein [Thomasclavelia cocleata]|uniref:ATP-binding cassette, subfamily B n=3 Tax=Thomasclavelia cocleata TaxID=69824 RepID=A0A1I0EKB2_9FIRM|nr:ABC transporter ATP-binding protein [Thomasclavelia cocleata]MCR1961242.1 ABC transporter ATP-binding protein/permease [Thomasclavelia cocleata]NDO41609.1 ABC transporter ATP-binding protein [Thomasclavelia cocleata]PJN80748.1 ABC transporter ATP-binding protein [Thomasclavelia cocleata]SET45620.1 ATP-binding cassette, subfamily B [Thomasclavelia cocleata]